MPCLNSTFINKLRFMPAFFVRCPKNTCQFEFGNEPFPVNFFILFLFAFSGLIIDTNLLVGISHTIGVALPFTYAFDALKRTILLGRPLLSLTFDLNYLFGSIIITYAIAVLLLRASRERLIT